jgi:coproporphyrinogen III oxidase
MEILRDEEIIDWWFGGGADLTPYYLYREDAIEFHQGLKEACDRFDATFYPKYKKECDDYFFIQHRKMARGVGGIFFDDLNSLPKEQLFDFIVACSEAIAASYPRIVARRKDEPFEDGHKHW